jgi:hypothetical protein
MVWPNVPRVLATLEPWAEIANAFGVNVIL